jgi:prepilin-type N-terminal cleavage/methylation domain-containing protein
MPMKYFKTEKTPATSHFPLFISHLQKGFTLVELLVVIGVLGVLASAVLVAVNPTQQFARARDSGKKSDAHQLSKAINNYITVQGQPPPNKSPGSAYCSNNADFLDELVTTGELKQIPRPSSGTYCYYNYGRGNSIGALVVVTLESIPPTATAPEGSCRPFTNNWCSNTNPSSQYCVCNPY